MTSNSRSSRSLRASWNRVPCHSPSLSDTAFAGLNSQEREFAAAILQAMEGRLLRYTKRLELMDLAYRLGIERFRAALLIAQVQHNCGGLSLQLPDERDEFVPAIEHRSPSRRTELFLKVAALLLMAGLADLVILRFLLG